MGNYKYHNSVHPYMRAMSFFETIRNLIAHPSQFFARSTVSFSDDIKYALSFLSVIALVQALFILPTFLLGMTRLPLPKFLVSVILLILLCAVLVGLGTLAIIIVYFLAHFFSRMFGSKKKFDHTFHLVYALTPLFLAGLVPRIGWFTLIATLLLVIAAADSIYLHYLGLREKHKLHHENAVAFVVVVAGIVFTCWLVIA